MIQSERKKGKNQNAETIHPFPPLRKGGGSSSRLIIGKFRPRLYTRFQLPARRSSSTFVNHRGYWDKRFLSAGMNRAHIAFARVKPCRPTRFLRHRRKRGPPTFYCVDEFFSPPFSPRRHGTPLPFPPSRVNNSSATLSKSPLLSPIRGGRDRIEIGRDNHGISWREMIETPAVGELSIVACTPHDRSI